MNEQNDTAPVTTDPQQTPSTPGSTEETQRPHSASSMDPAVESAFQILSRAADLAKTAPWLVRREPAAAWSVHVAYIAAIGALLSMMTLAQCRQQQAAENRVAWEDLSTSHQRGMARTQAEVDKARIESEAKVEIARALACNQGTPADGKPVASTEVALRRGDCCCPTLRCSAPSDAPDDRGAAAPPPARTAATR